MNARMPGQDLQTSAPAPEAPPPPRGFLQTLAAKAWALIVRPSAEWARIAEEPASSRSLFRDYLAVLAAIPALALLLRMLASRQFDPFGALFGSVVSYVLSLLGVYLLGEIVRLLADSFGARADRMAAMKTAVYASTPIWLAGIVFMVPSFDFFFVFSLYSVFLLHRGLIVVMKTPADKATGYASAVVGSAVVVFIVLITFAAMIAKPGPV
jgi:Yip1 domain